MKPMFESREAALAAPGLVYQHWKGGVYRVVGYIRAELLADAPLVTGVRYRDQEVTPSWGSPPAFQDLVVYEHLWPHAHQLYVRTAHEFFDHEARAGHIDGQGHHHLALGRKQRRFTPVTTDEARLMGQTDRLYVRELNL